MGNPSINKLQATMQSQEIANLLISDPISIDYLTQYQVGPGERLLLLILKADGQMYLILNQLFPAYQGEQENLEVITYHDGQAIMSQIAKILDPGRTGVDKTWPSAFLLELMQERQDLTFLNGSPLIDDLRAIKSQDEIDRMREASHRNDQAMAQMVELAKQGLSEQVMRDHLAKIYLELDCNGFSFEPIIAYGANGADPHHETDHTLPQAGNSLVIDIGSSYKQYCSDMTRTLFYGPISDRDRTIYETVLAANLAAIQAVKPGVSFASIDKTARQVIEEAGYGEYFTHRLGHSIGRDVHEAGDVGPFNEDLIQVGQVFSIEPGIYIPGEMGVRIEDLVVVTEDGCEVLNQYPKDLLIIDLPQAGD